MTEIESEPVFGAGSGELAFNPADPALQADPYPAYRILRDEFPVLRGPLGAWLVSRYEDCEMLLRDRRMGKDFANSKFFEQVMGEVGDEPPPFLGLGLDDWDAKLFMLTDPPEHTRLRGLVSQAFTPATIAALRESVAAIVEDLLGELPRHFDVMERLATPLPIRVLGTMLGIPAEDQARFTEWSAEIAGLLDLDVQLSPETARARREAVAACTTYFVDLATRRAASAGDDLISTLVRARDEGSALTTQEIAATCVLLVVAAQETFSNLLGNAAILFSRHPKAFARLVAEPQTMDATLDEILRLEPPPTRWGGSPCRRSNCTAGSSNRVTRSSCWWPRPTGTSASSPTPMPSTSTATAGATSPSAAASTTAWAPRWRS